MSAIITFVVVQKFVCASLFKYFFYLTMNSFSLQLTIFANRYKKEKHESVDIPTAVQIE